MDWFDRLTTLRARTVLWLSTALALAAFAAMELAALVGGPPLVEASAPTRANASSADAERRSPIDVYAARPRVTPDGDDFYAAKRAAPIEEQPATF